jgi:hypothetical protein
MTMRVATNRGAAFDSIAAALEQASPLTRPGERAWETDRVCGAHQ